LVFFHANDQVDSLWFFTISDLTFSTTWHPRRRQQRGELVLRARAP
jgi:hypothetical protein